MVLWEPIIPRMVAIGPVERASRSSRVTISTSPAPSAAIASLSCVRSVLAPRATSRNTFPAPAAFTLAKPITGPYGRPTQYSRPPMQTR